MLLAAPLLGTAQEAWDETGWLPEKDYVHFVYDFCGILDEEQTTILEESLLGFNDSTSNQVVLVTTPGFGGRDISSFAFELGDAWGIGQKEMNNGVLIVIRPKTDTHAGEVEIATGLGLEGALPDIFCKRIIEDVMLPRFRENDYFGGIEAALDIILPVCAGEYSFEQYQNDHPDGDGTATLIVFGCLAAYGVYSYRRWRKNGGKFSDWSNGTGGTSGGTWVGGSSWNDSSWGSGSSWSGGSSGPSFGGGSFGGGGASGKW